MVLLFRWSFGVLLYELFTLGNTPYPGIDPSDVEKYLEAGTRMSQPPHCPLEFYMIMLSCWQEFPDSRPAFTDLRQKLMRMLENLTEDYYYAQILARPSVAIGLGSRRPSTRQQDQPSLDDGDLDDQVFQESPDKLNVPEKPPPPLPPRLSRSRISSTDDDNIPPYSPTRRTHQREIGEPGVITESNNADGGFKFRYMTRYAPTELSPVPETSVQMIPSDHNLAIGNASVPSGVLVRRRSSTSSVQSVQRSLS